MHKVQNAMAAPVLPMLSPLALTALEHNLSADVLDKLAEALSAAAAEVRAVQEVAGHA